MSPDAQPGPPSDIADAGLAEAGRARIGWAQRGMPVLRLITERYAGEQPFAGLTVAACLHVTAETAGLVGALRAGGARVFLAASNLLSTQDDVAAALADAGTYVFARAGVDALSYAEHIHRVLDPGPDLVVDDGGDLVDTLAGRPELAANVRGGCESTTTGVLRLRRMAAVGALAIVTEVDPVRALDAVLRGYRVLPMREAAAVGEVIITATGSRDVVAAEHLAVLRDGAILANAGHFDAEVDVTALAGAAVKVTRDVRPHADEYTLPDGRRVVLLAEGRVVNLVAAEGNPPQVMDVSFAGQALVLRWLAGHHESLAVGVHDVPRAIDEEIARLTLESSGARIDTLTDAQRDYLNSWRATP